MTKRKRLPGRDAFYKWATTGRTPPLEMTWRDAMATVSGEEVPWAFLVAYSEFLSDVKKVGHYPVYEIAERVSPPEGHSEPGGAARRRNHDWRLFGLKYAYGRLWQTFAGIDEMAYCRDEADVHLAAKQTLVEFGRFVSGAEGPNLSAQEAERVGRGEMACDFPGGYEGWLRSVAWARNKYTIMFVVRDFGDGRGPQRVGVTVSLGLEPDTYACFRGGALDWFSIGAEGVSSGMSRHLVINSQAVDTTAAEHVEGNTQQLVKTTIVQLSLLAEDCTPVRGPCLLTAPASAAGEAQARRSGFRPVGTQTPSKKYPLVELSASSGISVRPQYIALTTFMFFCQSHNASERAAIKGD